MAGVVIFKSILGVGGFRLLWEGGGVKNKRNPNISPYGQRDAYDEHIQLFNYLGDYR